MFFISNSIHEEGSSRKYFFTLLLVVSSFITLGQLPLLFIQNYITNKNPNVIDLNDLLNVIGYNSFFALILFPFFVALFVLLICIKYIHKRPLLSYFTARLKFDWARFFFSFILWGGISFVFLVIMLFSGASIDFQFDIIKFSILCLLSFTLLVFQTFFEEVFFRGYILQAIFKLFKNGGVSVVFVGVLFGMLHASNPEVEALGPYLILYYIFSGIFLSLVVLFDDGLELSFGYHAVNNIFAAIILTNDWQAFRTDALFVDLSPAAFGLENILTIILIQPLMLFIFAKKYKWTNWREKIKYFKSIE